MDAKAPAPDEAALIRGLGNYAELAGKYPPALNASTMVIDWLIEKNRQGYAMVNSVDHLRAMKRYIRHEWPPWSCRAGELSMIIRLDGSFAPCFELYGAEEDWGNVYDGPKFDPAKLENQKKRMWQ